MERIIYNLGFFILILGLALVLTSDPIRYLGFVLIGLMIMLFSENINSYLSSVKSTKTKGLNTL